MLRNRVLSLVIPILLVCMLIIGCSNTSSTTSENKIEGKASKKDNTITIASKDNIISLDPHDSNDKESTNAQRPLYEGLVDFDKNMKVVPLLAESYDVSTDAKVYTFKLRKGVKFHDGEPFNAAAVKTNIDRLANPANKLKRYSLFAMVEKTEVMDEYTVKVALKEPFGAMINNFAHSAAKMISPKALEKYGKEIARHPVGTGPFRFVEWETEDHLKVGKNTEYWQEGLPKVDALIYKTVPENGTRIAMLQTGEVDIVFPFPTEQIEKMNGKDQITIESTPSITVRNLWMNTRKKPFDDVRIRQAINYAINKEAFIKVVYNGHAVAANSVIAPGVQFYAQQAPYEFNVEKAKQLLKEAGYENGFETEIWSGNSSATIKAMEFLQQQLAQVGIKAKVVPMEGGILEEKALNVQDPEKAEVSMYYSSWTPSTGDADWGLRPLFASESFPPKSNNVSYYKNDKVDELIRSALKTAEPEKRKAAYAEAQKIIWEEAPWVFLIVESNDIGKKDYIQGVDLFANKMLDVKGIEIKR